MYQHLRSSVQGFAHSLSKTVAGKRSRNRAPGARARQRRAFISLETLETRMLMTGEPTLTALDAANQPIVNGGTIKVKAGSPLWIPLDAEDAEGGRLTYQVTSSNPSVIANPQLANAADKWARINVRGMGTMVVQLFNSRVPRAADRFTNLAQAGAYNSTASTNEIFHRVIEGFVIQAGITTGSQGDQTAFDDAYDLDLQHNRTGILSLAKQGDQPGIEGDYTNTTQWFITDGPTRSLDFNHSVFGILVEGESVRAAIDTVATNSADKPVADVIIDSIEIFDNLEDSVMMLKAPPGIAAGTSQITVKVTDAQGNFTTKTFAVEVEADNANGSPFIADVPPQNIASGAPATFQLQVLDAEGETAPANLAYTAGIVGPPPPGVSANVGTGGLITVTRPAGFVGTVVVDANVRQTSPAPTTVDSTGDAQRITFNFLANAPTAVDLLASADTGYLDNDDITNASTLTFLVSGVQTNAVVRLYAGTTEIGQATATGDTVNVSVTSSTIPLGPNVITAKQTVGSGESAASAGLSLTYDPLILDFTSSATATAEGNIPFTYDAINPEEGQAGFSYSLINNPPSGMQINPQTGVVSWTPTQAGTVAFTVRGTDAAGNVKDHAVTVGVTAVRLAQFSIQFTDLNGAPITEIQKGQDFYLVGRVRDMRDTPNGIEAAFFDVAFDGSFATAVGQVEHGEVFNQDVSGTTSSGLIDEAGGRTTSTALAGQTTQLFRVKMRAVKVGAANFTADLAETQTSQVRGAGSTPATTLDADTIQFQGGTLNVNPNFTLAPGEFSVPEDSAGAELDVLATATKPPAETLTLVAVTQGNHAGQVAIVDGKVRYTPKANYFGEETFTYTAKNSDGDTRTATVTMVVSAVNDAPTATNDNFTALQNSEEQSFNVLLNDSFLPDGTENLKIKSVGTGSAQGTITIDPTGKVVRYKPKAGFVGTETFTYTIEDPAGLTATATATVVVSDVNDPPTLVNDIITVAQNSTDVELNVLGNDSIAPDTGETLTVTAKTEPQNGTLKLVNGKLLYTPKAGFRGSDIFTYTVTDSRGGVATASVTLRIADSNVAPVANNDTIATPRGVGVNIAVLKNDSTGADANESLVIISTTAPTNGSARIMPDGTIRYEPKDGFVGKDTFTYTVQDPLGETATATVEVTVNPLVASTIAGVVFQDLNNNGLRDTNEPGLAGVVVTLAGTTAGDSPVNVTATTDFQGAYRFADLDPGSYTITETQPAFLNDGRALPGSALGKANSANSMAITIGQENTHASAFNFSELGRKASFIRLYELFGSTSRSSVFAAVQAGGSTASWIQPNGTAWSALPKLNISLSSDQSQVVIETTDGNGQKMRGTLPASDPRVRVLGQEGNLHLVQVLGLPSAFNLQPVANVAPTFKVGTDRTVLEDATKVTAANFATEISAGTGESGQTVAFTVTVDKPGLFEEPPALAANGTLTFKVAANAVGVAKVTVVGKDSGGTAHGGQDTSTPRTFNITITAVNDAPAFTKGPNQAVAQNADTQTIANWATAIGAGGGADESEQTLTFTVVNNTNPNLFETPPAIASNGTLTYKPKPNTSGTATITVRLRDSGGTSNGGVDLLEQTFTVTVTGSNAPPVAGADTATTTEGAPVTVNVLANDSDPESQTLTVAVLTQPAHGTAAVNADKTITFTPAADYSGADSFTYELRDGNGGIATGTVNVTIANVNDAPVAGDDTATTNEDTSATIPLKTNDTDADPGDTLSFAVTTQPAHGQVTINASTGVATYTPASNYSGSDTFTYTMSDGHGGSDTATVTVTVTSVNDAPEIDVPADQDTEMDMAVFFSNDTNNAILVTDVDAGSSDVQVTLSIDPDQGTLTLGDPEAVEITTGGDGIDQTLIVFKGTLAEVAAALDFLSYTPAPGFTGTAVLDIEVDDLDTTTAGGAETATASVNIIVTDSSLDPFADEFFDSTATDLTDFVDAVDEFMASNE
jgi:cyclophilin family peptidyl-prolyl cis-trans isomerase